MLAREENELITRVASRHTDGRYHAPVLDASVARMGAAGTRLSAGTRQVAG